MQCHTQESVLTAWGGNLVDGDRNSPFASGRVYARNALPGALGDPEHVIRSPCEFPWPLQTGDEHFFVELFDSSRDGIRTILGGNRTKERQARQHTAHSGGGFH